MSRIGKEPIVLTKNVKAKIEGADIFIEGPKGKHTFKLPGQITAQIEDNAIVIKRVNDTKRVKSLHGTMRALVNNVVKGVSEGFMKELTIIGVGYKAQMKGKNLVLNMGFSHSVDMVVPQGLKVSVPAATRVIVEGIDKQQVGEFAAKIRSIYPPEPYKGKGIRYIGEEVRKKLGKALAK